MSHKPKGRILVVRGGAIGDFILTLPAISALRKQFPDAELEVLGYSHIAHLAVAGGLAKNVKSMESGGLAGFFARNGELDEGFAGYFSGFNLILSYLYDPDEVFKANVARCTRAQFVSGPHRPDESLAVHATEVFLKPLEQLAIFDADSVPRLEVVRAFENTVTAGRWIAAHPGSGSTSKNWPLHKWADLLQNVMKSTTMNLLLIGGEAEREWLGDLAAKLPPTRLKVLQSAPLPELARWLACCSAFIGHDSGITHLAAAVGVKSLALWGHTVEDVWRPRARELILLRDSRGLEHLAVDIVQNNLERLLAG